MPGGPKIVSLREFETVNQSDLRLYKSILAGFDDASTIIDIGSGDGGFLAVALRLGYKKVIAADFRATQKFQRILESNPRLRAEDFSTSISEYFSKTQNLYDVIHFSHVIEHIPKYALLETMDSLCAALRPGGLLIVRTPNMESPAAMSSFYVTLAHEYGFTCANLTQLLKITGFNQLDFVDVDYFMELHSRLIRAPFKVWQRTKSRLFGVSIGKYYGAELLVLARR